MCVTYNSSKCVTWLIHVCALNHLCVCPNDWEHIHEWVIICVCAMICPCMRHDSFICVTWCTCVPSLMCVCAMTHSYRWYDSIMCVTWLRCVAWLMCVKWLVRAPSLMCVCAMTHSCLCHDSFMCVTWLIHMLHDSFVHVTCFIHAHAIAFGTSKSARKGPTYVPWLIHICAMTHSRMCHDSLICVPRLIRVCDMTHQFQSSRRQSRDPLQLVSLCVYVCVFGGLVRVVFMHVCMRVCVRVCVWEKRTHTKINIQRPSLSVPPPIPPPRIHTTEDWHDTHTNAHARLAWRTYKYTQFTHRYTHTYRYRYRQAGR